MSLKFACCRQPHRSQPFPAPTHEPATEPAKWCSASLTSLFSPFSALLAVPSSRRDPPNAIAHRVHIGFRADAVIALGDRPRALSGGAQEHAGHRQAEGDRRKHECLDGSARPRPTTLDGKRMIWACNAASLFAPAKRTGLDRFEATAAAGRRRDKPARHLADGVEQGLGSRSGRPPCGGRHCGDRHRRSRTSCARETPLWLDRRSSVTSGARAWPKSRR